MAPEDPGRLFQAGNTRLVSKTNYTTEEALKQVLEMGMEEGFKQTLDNLEAYLVGNDN